MLLQIILACSLADCADSASCHSAKESTLLPCRQLAKAGYFQESTGWRGGKGLPQEPGLFYQENQLRKQLDKAGKDEEGWGRSKGQSGQHEKAQGAGYLPKAEVPSRWLTPTSWSLDVLSSQLLFEKRDSHSIPETTLAVISLRLLQLNLIWDVCSLDVYLNTKAAQ